MLFVHPMWDNESERWGLRLCTPWGYALRAVGALIGFAGLLLLGCVGAWLVWSWASGRFEAGSLWMLVWPLGLGVLSELMVQGSWAAARRKGFSYDAAKREASWIAGGERVRYRWPGTVERCEGGEADGEERTEGD